MRILASNPDTLGDFVLRQPMYRALEEAGHELLLVVRKGVEPLARYVAPSAKTLVLPAEVYASDSGEHWAQFDDTVRAAGAFEPDVLLVAPYRWTLFEENLAGALPQTVKRIGMSGHLYAGDPYAGRSPASRMRFDVVAEVVEELPEVEKNAALCAAVLGTPPRRADPRLEASEESLDLAKQTLSRLSLEPGGYWIACVGGTAHVSIKTWPAEHWGRVLGEWAKARGRKFLFVGLPEERPAAEAVRGAMAEMLGSDAAARHAALWLEPHATLDDLLALTQLAAGYVGHDTGPMHIAAAMGKPTAAVFGGGTWPRFRPAVDPSVALLIGVPCVGCGWACSFSTSHCIKRVPPEEVLAAALDLDLGRIAGREARVLEPGRDLQVQMIHEAAVTVQEQVREKATVAGRLREAEGVLAAGDGAGWVAGMRSELQAARGEAHRAADAAAQRAAETSLLRRDLELRATESARLAATLEAQTLEVNHLREEIRGILRDVERAGGGSGARAPDGLIPPGAITGADAGAPAAGPSTRGRVGANGAPATNESRDGEIARLRSAVERLDARVRELEPRVRPVRRPLRQVLTDLVIGGKYYPRRAPLQLPRVTFVTPALNDADAVRDTIESVLSQNYHHLRQVVVDCGSTNGTLDALRQYEDRIDRVVSDPGADEAGAMATAFESAEADVLSVLRAGDVLEPGGVMRVAEYFARHPGVNVVYSEDAVVYPGGWKFPAPPQPTPDVYHMLDLARRGRRFVNGVFFRRGAYLALGPLNPKFGRAAEWELLTRLARRFELRRLDGHVRSVRVERVLKTDPADAADLAAARESFEQTFGTAGRLRCRMLGAAHRVFDAFRTAAAGRLFFPLAPDGTGRDVGAPPLPACDTPARAPGQPVCPLTDRPPDRLLFSTPDTTGGDRTIHHVYYDSESDAALAYPPLPAERLGAMYAARDGRAPEVSVPDAALRSPYARFRGVAVGDLLQRLPSPYWWFNEPDFGDATGGDALGVLRGLVDPADERIRLLVVGCFDGGVLDPFKAKTRWQVSGTETNAAAVARARARGHVVWEIPPQDAPLALPVGAPFDIVFLANTAEHLDDPLLVLRRLSRLLRPGGWIVLNQPNLDSAHVGVFGPTWGRWQVPYHRVLTGRRGLKRMAALADLRVVRTRTRTLPYPTCVSVQLNDLGLAAVVPDTARFPNSIASRGVRLTGWSRLLWDWRGRGDFLFAVLKPL